jgi:hypothetical protein
MRWRSSARGWRVSWPAAPAEAGHEVVLLDKGRPRRPSGDPPHRCGDARSRRAVLHVRSEAFAARVHRWEADGLALVPRFEVEDGHPRYAVRGG